MTALAAGSACTEYRSIPNVLAAIGLAQLERADFYLECRRSNAVRYNALLSGQRGITIPPELPWTTNSYWMYSILIGDDFGISRRVAFDWSGGSVKGSQTKTRVDAP